MKHVLVVKNRSWCWQLQVKPNLGSSGLIVVSNEYLSTYRRKVPYFPSSLPFRIVAMDQLLPVTVHYCC